MSWTTISQVRELVRKRWVRGVYINDYAAGNTWEPLRVKVSAPTASDILDRTDQVDAWLRKFRNGSNISSGTGQSGFVIETKVVQNRRLGLGSNVLPAYVRFESFEDLTHFAGLSGEVVALDQCLALTQQALPSLVDWARAHPLKVIANNQVWTQLLATVGWVEAHGGESLFIRQLDVVGVDTKFVESHRSILSEMLVEVLPASRYDLEIPLPRFAGRFGLREKPVYLRLRFLDPFLRQTHGYSELTVRADELKPLSASRALIVENEISFLALPDVNDAVAVFGSGFGVSTLASIDWLRTKKLVYWGDIDTWGFSILDQLRQAHEHVESVLMDEKTLLDHSDHWNQERRQTERSLGRLTAAEAHVYEGLLSGRYGESVRLEQERIRFSAVETALAWPPMPNLS